MKTIRMITYRKTNETRQPSEYNGLKPQYTKGQKVVNTIGSIFIGIFLLCVFAIMVGIMMAPGLSH